LDALAIGASSYLLGIDGATAPLIEPEEVRLVWQRASGLDSVELQFRVTVACDGVVGGFHLEWSRSLRGAKARTTGDQARRIATVAQAAQERVRAGTHQLLPVICYYGTGRLRQGAGEVRKRQG